MRIMVHSVITDEQRITLDAGRQAEVLLFDLD